MILAPRSAWESSLQYKRKALSSARYRFQSMSPPIMNLKIYITARKRDGRHGS